MIEVTETASTVIKEIMAKQEKPSPIRIIFQSSC